MELSYIGFVISHYYCHVSKYLDNLIEGGVYQLAVPYYGKVRDRREI